MLRLFDPWSNFEHVQNLSRVVKDVQELLHIIPDAIRNIYGPIQIAMYDAGSYPWLILRPIRESVTWA